MPSSPPGGIGGPHPASGSPWTRSVASRSGRSPTRNPPTVPTNFSVAVNVREGGGGATRGSGGEANAELLVAVRHDLRRRILRAMFEEAGQPGHIRGELLTLSGRRGVG